MSIESYAESKLAELGHNTMDAGRAFVQSTIETPVNGLLEMVHAERKLKLVDAPDKKDTGAKIGHYAGVALDTIATATILNKVKIGDAKPGIVAASALAGALYQGLTPTGGDIKSHAGNALEGAFTFGLLTASSKFMKNEFEYTNLAAKIEHLSTPLKVASKLGVASTIGALSGLFTGTLDPRATGEDLKKYAMLGAMLGPVGESFDMVTGKSSTGTIINFKKAGVNSDPSPEAAKTLDIQNEQKSSFFKDADTEKRFPTLKGTVRADVAVVGGGVGGLQVARELANRGLDTVLVEGARIGGSTSGRMGAMITRSSDGSAQDHMELYGGPRTEQIIDDLASAQKRVTRLAKSYPDVDYVAGNSNQVSYKTAAEDDYLKKEYDILRDKDPNVSYLSGEAAHDLSPTIQGPTVEQALILHDEGSVNPRKFALAMASEGIFPVYEDSQVTGLTIDGKRAPVEVHTKDGIVMADHAVFATNGPAPTFEHLYPLLEREQAFATSVSADTSRMRNDNYFDTDGLESPHQIPGEEEYNFFRAIGKPAKDGELLFGGGSLWPDKGTIGKNSQVLEEQLQQFVPGAKINTAWSGLLYNTEDGLPIVEQHPQFPQVHNVTALGGIGLVNGALSARNIGAKLAGYDADDFYTSQRLQSGDAETIVKDWSKMRTDSSSRTQMLFAPQPACVDGQKPGTDVCPAH